MTKSLTEQWREGTLEQKYYYVKYFGSGQKPFVEIELKNFLLDLVKVKDRDKIEVLATVPSWDEYQTLIFKAYRPINPVSNAIMCYDKEREKKAVKKLEKKLKIATKALEEINKNYRFTVAQDVVYKALKEMEGVK